MYANPLAEMMKTDKKPDILSHLYQPFAQTTGAGESIIFLSLGKKSERGLRIWGLWKPWKSAKEHCGFPPFPQARTQRSPRAFKASRMAGQQTERR